MNQDTAAAAPGAMAAQPTPSATPDPGAQPAAAATADPATRAAGGVSVMEVAVISACVSLALVACVLAGYHVNFKPPVRQVATIDLEALVAAKEMAFLERLSRPGISETDREDAYETVRRFGRDLDEAIAQAGRDCACDIFVRAAVVGRPSRDLTDEVGQRIGITANAVSQGRERIRAALNGARPNLEPPQARDPSSVFSSSGARP